MSSGPVEKLEGVLMEYVAKYGLTERARKYFLDRSEEERGNAADYKAEAQEQSSTR